MSAEVIPAEKTFVDEAKQIVLHGRQQASRALNSIIIETYWQLGKRIVEQEQCGKNHADYGSYLLKLLSVELTRAFGKGFTARALRHYRQFYAAFPEEKMWNTRVPHLSWSHFRTLLRVENLRGIPFFTKIRNCLRQNTCSFFRPKKNYVEKSNNKMRTFFVMIHEKF